MRSLEEIYVYSAHCISSFIETNYCIDPSVDHRDCCHVSIIPWQLVWNFDWKTLNPGSHAYVLASNKRVTMQRVIYVCIQLYLPFY